MSLNKVNYIDGQTIISATNLNNIQQAIIDNENKFKNYLPLGGGEISGDLGIKGDISLYSSQSEGVLVVSEGAPEKPALMFYGTNGDEPVELRGIENPTMASAAANKEYVDNCSYISVKNFGAKGDGSTDDTAAIQAAIDSVSSNGRALYFPAGTYIISSPLHVEVETGSTTVGNKTKSKYTYGMGLTLRGEQVGKTVLRKTGQSKYTIPTDNNVNGGTEVDTTLFFGGSMGTGLYISDISIENASADECYAIYATRARVNLDKLNICTNSHGIYLYGWLNNLTDVLIQATEKGLWVSNATSTVCNKVFVAGCNNPFYLNSAYYSTLISCCADTCTGTIWTLAGTVTMIGCGSESKDATHYIETIGANTQVNAEGLYFFDLITGSNESDGLNKTYFQTSGLNNILTVNRLMICGLEGSSAVNNALVSQTGGSSTFSLRHINTAPNGGNVNTLSLYKGSLENGSVFELNCLGYHGWYKWSATSSKLEAITEAEIKNGSVTPEKTSFITPAEGHYEAQPNYTNLAPLGVDPGAGLTYNEYGGCRGYRYASTFTRGQPLSNTGTSSVNLAIKAIPLPNGVGDTIRSKGWYISSSSNDNFFILDENLNVLGGSNGTNIFSEDGQALYGVITDADAQTTEFTIPQKDLAGRSLAGAKYFVGNGRPNQTGSFIITVNEPIADKQVWVGTPMRFGNEVKQNMENVFIQSPNGTLFTLTVSDNGTLSTVPFQGGEEVNAYLNMEEASF